MVVRCPAYLSKNGFEMKVKTIDSLTMDGSVQSGISVGPLFNTACFEEHSINKDASLGSNAPFANRPAARAVIYETKDGLRHLRLFDGRPGSTVFAGVTPREAVRIIQAEGEVAWGCFLDGGQTAKLCVKQGPTISNFGNMHYVNAIQTIQKNGRPISSAITLR